ncbi:MAG: HEAT repeat domain-containing protein, partial [Planktothrix sp.]
TQPFQDEQMQEFIRRWFRGLVAAGEDVKLAESLWSELQAVGKERIKDLCCNPLRLTLLCSTWKVKAALPETTAQLYEGFVESIYAWKKAFTVKKEEKKQLNAALGALAKVSLEAETSRFRLTHRLVGKYLGEPDEDSLLDTALRLGWLNDVGVAAENPRERVYGFYHATFQEYFAALAVEDWDYFLPRNHVDCPVEGKQYRIFEPQWKQVILLWLGREDVGAEEKEGFIQALVAFKCGVENFYECQAYFLAAAGIDEFKTCSLATEIVRQVVKWGFGYFNIEKQKWTTVLAPIQEGARKAIPETIRPLAISSLIDIFNYCPSKDTWSQVIESLGEIGQGSQEVITTFVKLIETTEDDYICGLIAESLGKIGEENPQAITALVNLIRSGDGEYSHKIAVISLGKISPGSLEEIASLVKVIETYDDYETDYDPKTTWMCYSERLGKIGKGNPQAIANLIKIIGTTESQNKQWRATYTLREIGEGNPQAVAGLVEIIETTDNPVVQWWSTYSLGQIGEGNPQAITTVVNLIKTTNDTDTH